MQVWLTCDLVHIHSVVPLHAADAPPSSVIKCLWEVFVWGFGVLFLSCVCVSVSGVLFSVGVCVFVDVLTCDLVYIHSGVPLPAAGAPPSSVVKCLWQVFVWGFGVLFLSCVCVFDMLIFAHSQRGAPTCRRPTHRPDALPTLVFTCTAYVC